MRVAPDTQRFGHIISEIVVGWCAPEIRFGILAAYTIIIDAVPDNASLRKVKCAGYFSRSEVDIATAFFDLQASLLTGCLSKIITGRLELFPCNLMPRG